MSIAFSIRLKKAPKAPPSVPDDYFIQGSNGATVILIHGLTGTPNEMGYLAKYLNKSGYSVYSPRLANHGEPLWILKKSKWQDFYESCRAALRFAEEKNKGGIVFAGGLCMGGTLAFLLAEEFPGRISGATCLAPTLFYDGWNMPWYTITLPMYYYTPLKHFFYFKEDPPYGIKNETIRQLVHEYYGKADLNDLKKVDQYGYPFVPATLLYQNHLLIRYFIKKLPFIKVPIQLIQAREDDTTSIRNSEFIYARVNSAVKEKIYLEDSYHLITIDRERDKVAQGMENFFTRIRKDLASGGSR